MTPRAPIDERLAARILSSPDLPSLPAVALRVLELCQEDEVNLAAIAAAVAPDPAISAKLLRLANSASFATRGKVASLSRAVALLGTNATLAVTLSFSLVGGRRRHDASGFDHAAFWRRALFSAIAGRALGLVVEHDQEDAFVGCLLQDLGMLALNGVFPGDYGQVCLAAQAEHDTLAALEAELLGADHVQVGCLLARRWNLPERLQEAICLSHAPPERPAGRAGLTLPEAVYLSGCLADLWISDRPTAATRAALGSATERLGLAPATVAAALTRMAAAVPEASTDFDLDLGGPGRVQAVLEEAQRLLQARRPTGAPPEPEGVGPVPAETFLLLLEEEVERARSGERPVALLACRAPAEPDQADAETALLLLASLRQSDVLSRQGGHYLALLVDTPAGGAQVVAKRIQACLAAAKRDAAVGLACLPDATIHTAAQLLAAAEGRLGPAAAGDAP
ncbi:MAG: HDOD domain-containing protein [Anaeromyxobacter sp.]|nr:HDOD domain-containing protein [Anaeromyxobacter sp.]